MDWFGLTDPFTQQVPLKITNTYSGTLWFQSQLVNPRSGYYNYSGIQLGNVNSGASTTLAATWGVGVSGWIVGSSPITDTLTLNLTTFTSSNYTGSYSSGNFTIPNTLFNRYSGVIKVFGDIYSNNQPLISLTQTTGGGLSGTYSYAVSYILSGWESDVSVPSTLTLGSGFYTILVSWAPVTFATQYYVWRWSGSTDFTLAQSRVLSGTMDLAAIVSTNGYTDSGGQLQTGYYRHRNWQDVGGTAPTSDSAVYLTPPNSRQVLASRLYGHTFMLGKNASGTTLLGPFYGIVHTRTVGAAWQVLLGNQTATLVSGTPIADADALSNITSSVWYRNAILLGNLSASGVVHIQFITGATLNFDDVFIVAQS